MSETTEAGLVLGRPDQLKLYNEQGQLLETVLIDAGMSYLRTFEWAPRVMSVEFHRGTTAAEIAALLSSAREEGAAAERERIQAWLNEVLDEYAPTDAEIKAWTGTMPLWHALRSARDGDL